LRLAVVAVGFAAGFATALEAVVFLAVSAMVNPFALVVGMKTPALD
jgi:hypothetical protein